MQLTDSGAGRVKALLSILFLVFVVFAGVKIIPVYVNNYELDDYIREQTPYWLTQRARELQDLTRRKEFDAVRRRIGHSLP